MRAHLARMDLGDGFALSHQPLATARNYNSVSSASSHQPLVGATAPNYNSVSYVCLFPLLRPPCTPSLSPGSPSSLAQLLLLPQLWRLLTTSPLPPGARSALSIQRRLVRQSLGVVAASECCGPRHLAKRARRSYELLKAALMQPTQDPSIGLKMFCGSCSGVAAMLCTLPFDTLVSKFRRTRGRRPVVEMRVALPRVALLSALCLPLFDVATRSLCTDS